MKVGLSTILPLFVVTILYIYTTSDAMLKATLLVTESARQGCRDTAPLLENRTKSIQRMVPSFYKRGGLIFFFHVAKAGGTTIRSLFQSYDNVTVGVRVRWGKPSGRQALQNARKMASGKFGNNLSSLVIEIHDSVNVTFWDMASTLRELRMLAQKNDVPFFVFATLREPLSYSLSFYNFQNLGDGRCGRYEAGLGTEEDFMRLSLPNPQCIFFSRSEEATTKNGSAMRENFTLSECRALYDIVQENMDWIGVMESMQTETLPLLTYMLSQDTDKGRNFKPLNVLKKRRHVQMIKAEHLSASTVAHLRNMTHGDAEWYRRIHDDYPIQMWTDL